MLTLATTPTTNEKQGNGRYSTLRRRKKQKKNEKKSNKGFSYLRKNKDLTMKFSDSKDPLYLAFDYLDERSLPELMCDFVQDSFFEITKFVSKVVAK